MKHTVNVLLIYRKPELQKWPWAIWTSHYTSSSPARVSEPHKWLKLHTAWCSLTFVSSQSGKLGSINVPFPFTIFTRMAYSIFFVFVPRLNESELVQQAKRFLKQRGSFVCIGSTKCQIVWRVQWNWLSKIITKQAAPQRPSIKGLRYCQIPWYQVSSTKHAWRPLKQ